MKKDLRSQYLGKTKVVNSDGQVVTAHVIKKYVHHNYWKVSVENLIRNLGDMTPKSMRVIDFLLNHTNYKNNSYIGTNHSIADKCKGVGYTKVATTLSFLNNHKIIHRKPGVIMWNPTILNHRKQYQVPDLIIKYRVFNHTYKIVKPTTKADKARTAKARKVLQLKRDKEKLNKLRSEIRLDKKRYEKLQNKKQLLNRH